MTDRKEKLFFIGIKALIQNDDGKILLLKADVANHRMNTEEYWDIPGGRIEHGDSEADTLKKEVEEETGIKLSDNGEFVATVFSNHEIPLYEGGVAGLVLRIWKVPYTPDMTVQLSSEHTEYKWSEPIEAAQLLGHKYPSEFCDEIAKL